MLKTNSKEAKNRIRLWIMDHFEPENYGIEKPETFKESARIILETFEKEYLYGYNMRRNRQEVFADWCYGLPSILDTTAYCYNGSAVDLLGDLLDETPEERNKYDEMEAENLMTWLIYRELTAATR